MLVQRERASVGGDAGNSGPAAPRRGKRERHVELGVVGKAFGEREVDRGAIARQRVAPLIAALQRQRHLVPIAEDEVGGVDEQAAAFLGQEWQSRDGALRKRLRDGEGVCAVGQ